MKTDKGFKRNLMSVGTILAELREKKGFSTIKEFADRYDLPAIQYWRIEKGKANITLRSLFKILTIHNLSFHDFFCLMVEEPYA